MEKIGIDWVISSTIIGLFVAIFWLIKELLKKNSESSERQRIADQRHSDKQIDLILSSFKSYTEQSASNFKDLINKFDEIKKQTHEDNKVFKESLSEVVFDSRMTNRSLSTLEKSSIEKIEKVNSKNSELSKKIEKSHTHLNNRIKKNENEIQNLENRSNNRFNKIESKLNK